MFGEITDALGRIETQTKKTNGSVAHLKKWQERSIGAGSILAILIVPILGWAMLQVIANASTIIMLKTELYQLNHPATK